MVVAGAELQRRNQLKQAWLSEGVAVAPGGTVFTGNGDRTVRVLKLGKSR